MLVTSEKIENKNMPDNACRNCDGVGQKEMLSGNIEFLAECSHCRGEKVITVDLLNRKELGQKLREILIEKRLLIREAADKFGGGFVHWNDCVQGKSPAFVIQAKIDLFLKQASPPGATGKGI